MLRKVFLISMVTSVGILRLVENFVGLLIPVVVSMLVSSLIFLLWFLFLLCYHGLFNQLRLFYERVSLILRIMFLFIIFVFFIGRVRLIVIMSWAVPFSFKVARVRTFAHVIKIEGSPGAEVVHGRMATVSVARSDGLILHN